MHFRFLVVHIDSAVYHIRVCKILPLMIDKALYVFSPSIMTGDGTSIGYCSMNGFDSHQGLSGFIYGGDT